MTLRGLLLAVVFQAASPVDAAACHRHAIWHYPWPQRCGVVVKSVRVSDLVASARRQPNPRNRPFRQPHRPTSEPDIPIPFLARADLDGGEADEATRGRLLLRAALEAPDGH
jgi:hypothetical protein